MVLKGDGGYGRSDVEYIEMDCSPRKWNNEIFGLLDVGAIVSILYGTLRGCGGEWKEGWSDGTDDSEEQRASTRDGRRERDGTKTSSKG